MGWKEFFCFNKSDRQVLVILVCAIAAFLTGTYLFRDHAEPENEMAADLVKGERQNSHGPKAQAYYRVEGRKAELFPFDPNTADSTQLLRLGLQPWQVRNIYHYRAAGGIYRKPEDFARLYGLTVKQYRALAPYIRISADYQPASTLYGSYAQGSSSSSYHPDQSSHEVPYDAASQRSTHHGDTLRYPTKLKAGEQIALNTSDTTMLKRVPGIGSYYARKIVRYRERLGGFSQASQLMEIEGFPENALPYFSVQQKDIHRLNVNKLTAAQLRNHPYINYFMAKAITDYRRLKGPIHSLQDLSLLPEFSPEAIQRLEPYVEF